MSPGGLDLTSNPIPARQPLKPLVLPEIRAVESITLDIPNIQETTPEIISGAE
jgi:hypothetical protein